MMEQETRLGQVIILNGAPRSGKSSIATAIQEASDELWMNLGADCYIRTTPEQYRPGVGLRPAGIERMEEKPFALRTLKRNSPFQVIVLKAGFIYIPTVDREASSPRAAQDTSLPGRVCEDWIIRTQELSQGSQRIVSPGAA